MIVAFVGTMEDESFCPISGNGKTISMVFVSYLDNIEKGKTIWSNFYTDYSEKICGMQEMINNIGDKPHPHLILCLSEMQKIINSLGSENKKVLFIENFASQLRKLDIDLYYDTQRFKNIHVRLRTFTDIIFIPRKFHFDGRECNYNLCDEEPHMITLYSAKPLREDELITFDAAKVGAHYNTRQIIYDKITL